MHFWVRGAKNDVLADFAEEVIFRTIFKDENKYARKKTKAERSDVLFIQTIDIRQLSAWITDLRDHMIFSARMRNVDQLMR